MDSLRGDLLIMQSPPPPLDGAAWWDTASPAVPGDAPRGVAANVYDAFQASSSVSDAAAEGGGGGMAGVAAAAAVALDSMASRGGDRSDRGDRGGGVATRRPGVGGGYGTSGVGGGNHPASQGQGSLPSTGPAAELGWAFAAGPGAPPKTADPGPSHQDTYAAPPVSTPMGMLPTPPPPQGAGGWAAPAVDEARQRYAPYPGRGEWSAGPHEAPAGGSYLPPRYTPASDMPVVSGASRWSSFAYGDGDRRMRAPVPPPTRLECIKPPNSGVPLLYPPAPQAAPSATGCAVPRGAYGGLSGHVPVGWSGVSLSAPPPLPPPPPPPPGVVVYHQGATLKNTDGEGALPPPVVAPPQPRPGEPSGNSSPATGGGSRPRRHSCPQCDRAFTERSNLTKHLTAVHLRLRPHVCGTCNAAFAARCNLFKHRTAVHDRARPHTCTTCGAAFAERNKRDKHAATVHGGERRHCCDRCPARFGQASDLRRHTRVVHDGERAWACTDCGRRFGRKATLAYHQRVVHGGGGEGGSAD